MITIRELTRDLELELLAGADAADAPIHWVHISEEPDPTPWLVEGDLLLCTAKTLTDEVAQREYVERLADRGLAGLGCGSGFGVVAPALVAAARERDFPVFGIPFDMPFGAVTERAFATLVNDNYAVLRRAVVAQESLEQIVLTENGVEAIAATLATQIGGELLIFDGRGQLLTQRTAHYGLSDDLVDALSHELAARTQSGAADAFAPEAGGLLGRALAIPVAASAEFAAHGAAPQAWLVAAKVSGFDEFDRLLLHRAVTVVALELMRRRVSGSTQRRLADEILSQVAAGTLAGPELERRLAPFQLGDRVAALALRMPEVGEALETALDAALRDEALEGLVASVDGLACALLPGYADDELFDLAERIHRRVSENVGGVQTGVGRAVAAADMRRTYHEARCALEARDMRAAERTTTEGATSGEPPASPVATYRDLGSMELLLSLQDTAALRLYCDSLLGPLEDGENGYGGELLRSLEAFIDCNGQWEAAAKRLYCHRHTLRYRIRRIEELTGRDLSSARDRIEFWLAIRGRELVQ